VCKAGENVNKVSEDKIIKKMDFNSTSIHTTKKHVDKTNSRYYLDVKAYYYVFTL
jgi:hypothetical protein